MEKIIEFINTSAVELDKPIRAEKSLPDWFKKIPSYTWGEKLPPHPDVADKHETSSTVKKCVPVYDALTSGYLLTLPTDLNVIQNNGAPPYFQWPTFELVRFQAPDQITGHPVEKTYSKKFNPCADIPKIENPWRIKTPKGYSCIFLPPMHRENIITVLPAIVDTDFHDVTIKFPFVLSDPSFEGIIPAGTPYVQVIPFKRESWKSDYKEESLEKKGSKIQTVFFDGYRKMVWNKKTFK